MRLKDINQPGSENNEKPQPAKGPPPWMKRSLCGLLILLLGSLGFLSLPVGVLSKMTSLVSLQPGRTPPFVRDLRSLSGDPRRLQDSANLASAIASRIGQINRTREPLLDPGMVDALARADWYFYSGEDVGRHYGGQPLRISEGHLLSAVRRFLQQRGQRLPVTRWHAPMSTGPELTGEIPPVEWASRPPSDQTLQGIIRSVRSRLSEQVPGIAGSKGTGAILRPLEAALVAYVLMTADNGWIGTGRAEMNLSATEMRSFLTDLGIAFSTR